jgi:hypothetical protein
MTGPRSDPKNAAFPGSDPVNVIQPPPSKADRHVKRKD